MRVSGEKELEKAKVDFVRRCEEDDYLEWVGFRIRRSAELTREE